jgi:uncharacterized protein (DUF2141 family)
MKRTLILLPFTAMALIGLGGCDMFRPGSNEVGADTLAVEQLEALTDCTATAVATTPAPAPGAEVKKEKTKAAGSTPAKEAKGAAPKVEDPNSTADGRLMPLTLKVTDLVSHTAPIILSFYVVEKTFLDKKAQLKTYRFVPSGPTFEVKIKDLPFGTYAIAMYQDMNDSGHIDRNFLGIPKEPYAFSNNIRPMAAAPKFKDCKFIYSKDRSLVSMRLVK